MQTAGYISDEFYEMIPRKETFEILGLFSKAVYFRGSTGSILLIFEDKFGSVPFGVTVGDFRELCLDEKCEVLLEGGRLTFFKDGTKVQELILTERKSKKARPGRSLKGFLERALPALAAGRGVLKKVVLKEAEETVYSGKLVHELAVIEGHPGKEQLKASLQRIIGLGPGLTPSCDDFFVGFLYAQKYFGMENALLRECIEEVASSQTTASSAAFLQSVCAGRTISVIEDLFAARSEEELDAALALLLGVGSNSGADILTGVLEGMRFCQEHM